MTTSSVVLRDHGLFTLFLPTDQAFSDNLDDREVLYTALIVRV